MRKRVPRGRAPWLSAMATETWADRLLRREGLFWLTIGWPCRFGLTVAHRGHSARQGSTWLRSERRKRKRLGSHRLLGEHAPRALKTSTRLHLLKSPHLPRAPSGGPALNTGASRGIPGPHCSMHRAFIKPSLCWASRNASRPSKAPASHNLRCLITMHSNHKSVAKG